MADKQTQLLIAYFNSFDEADLAAKSLKDWDKANDDIKLGAIGVLHQEANGKIKTKKYGQHNTGSGARIGLLLGVLAALFAPATLIAGAAYGAIGGGILGSFSKKGLGLTDEELTEIKNQVAGGKAALAVLAAPDEVDAISAELTTLGGATSTHEAPTDEIQQVATEVNAPAPDEVEGETAAPAEAEMAAPAAAEAAAPAMVSRTVVITTVHYEGEEYVQLRNDGAEAVDLGGWTLLDKNDDKSSMTFPEGTELKPGSTVRVFTEPGHALTFNSSRPIWHNMGDIAVLLNPEGEQVSVYSYGSN